MVEHRLRGESLWLSPFRDPPRPPGTKGMRVGPGALENHRVGGASAPQGTWQLVDEIF